MKRASWISICGAAAVALAATSCKGRLPEHPGYTVQHDGITCVHPPVIERCRDGWCEIPPGCFLMGSPESEQDRGRYNERLTAVTLTRGFVIQQTELTQAQWLELVDKNPTGTRTAEHSIIGTCLDPSCPVTLVSWQAAAAFANRMSRRDGYQDCYQLVGCRGELGTLGFRCTDVRLLTPTTHECAGYRLPTAAEWEYAARAGTLTSFYTGDNHTDPWPGRTCAQPEPVTDPIAWSCHNTPGCNLVNQGTPDCKPRPVAQKRPNHWGLYDMLGNVEEPTSWLDAEPDPPGPLTDPQKTLGRYDERHYFWIIKGGSMAVSDVSLRAAEEDGNSQNHQSTVTGLRLVRTLGAPGIGVGGSAGGADGEVAPDAGDGADGGAADAPRVCHCNTPGVTLTPAASCTWLDSNQCSGLAEIFCDKECVYADADTPYSCEQDCVRRFDSIPLASGATYTGLRCAITVTCPAP